MTTQYRCEKWQECNDKSCPHMNEHLPIYAGLLNCTQNHCSDRSGICIPIPPATADKPWETPLWSLITSGKVNDPSVIWTQAQLEAARALYEAMEKVGAVKHVTKCTNCRKLDESLDNCADCDDVMECLDTCPGCVFKRLLKPEGRG